MPVILITSANGKTARHIMPLLLKAGSSVRALSHRMPAAPIEGVEWVTGDINDPNTIARCIDGARSPFAHGVADWTARIVASRVVAARFS